MDFCEQSGTFQVPCSEILFGTKETELSYTLYPQGTENLSEHLDFIQAHFQEMYDIILKKLLTAYRKYPKWDIWEEETKTFSRIELSSPEEVHSRIGIPRVEIMRHENRVITGFSFYKNNRMSIEHGFCAIFDRCNLLLIGDSDFCNILRCWEYAGRFDILKIV